MEAKQTVTTGAICVPELFEFPAVKKRVLRASLSGRDATRYGRVDLLRQVDCRLGLTKELARRLPDPRGHHSIDHPLLGLVYQGIYRTGSRV